MYNKFWVYVWVEINSDLVSFRFEFNINFNGVVIDSWVIFLVKGDSILYKISFFVNVQDQVSLLEVQLVVGEMVFLEYYFIDWEMVSQVEEVVVFCIIIVNGEEQMENLSIVYYLFIDFNDIIFGLLYCYWGQFEYNGNCDWVDLFINEVELILDENVEDFGEIFDDFDELEGFFDLVMVFFLIMFFDVKIQCYFGYDNFIFVSVQVVSSLWLGEDNILLFLFVSSGEGFIVFNWVMEIDEYSVAGGLGFLVLIGIVS